MEIFYVKTAHPYLTVMSAKTTPRQNYSPRNSWMILESLLILHQRSICVKQTHAPGVLNLVQSFLSFAEKSLLKLDPGELQLVHECSTTNFFFLLCLVQNIAQCLEDTPFQRNGRVT